MANQTSGKDGKGRELICSFCGRSQNEVEQLVIGPGVNICKDCIEMCCNVLERDGERPAPAARRYAAPVTAAVRPRSPAQITVPIRSRASIS